MGVPTGQAGHAAFNNDFAVAWSVVREIGEKYQVAPEKPRIPEIPKPDPDESDPRFACDAMLKGLTRWLRAYGYDATWQYGIDDRTLVEESGEEGRCLLTSDGPLMARRTLREGPPRALYLPMGMAPLEQLGYVIGRLSLPRRLPRCMKCGGRLDSVPKESVADEAPPRTYAWLDDFFRCARCQGLFWKGTHWSRIAAGLDTMSEPPSCGSRSLE